MRGQVSERRVWARRGGMAIALGAVWAMAIGGGWAASKPPVVCQVTVHITNDQRQPVANAGVVMDQVANLKRHKVKDAVHVEVKSDSQGNATMGDFVPGVVLIQVIAPGYNTFGKYFYVRQAKTVIQVHLSPPGKQISAFH